MTEQETETKTETEQETKADTNLFETPDLGFSAYLKMNGLKFLRIEKNKFKPMFVLEDPEGRAKELQREYMDSPEQRFDSEIRLIKLMMRSEFKKT